MSIGANNLVRTYQRQSRTLGLDRSCVRICSARDTQFEFFAVQFPIS
jgi:hypothetical protein